MKQQHMLTTFWILTRVGLVLEENRKSESNLNFWSNNPDLSIFLSTTYGLYRDGTELRAVYYALPNVARSACLSLGDACDYPILLGMSFARKLSSILMALCRQ